ncbi:hypothetical protein DsansV1_C01g0011111 [Dioscorea sansibarensis]
MASTHLLLLIFFMSISLCMSNPDAVGIVAKALTCFNDHYVSLFMIFFFGTQMIYICKLFFLSIFKIF